MDINEISGFAALSPKGALQVFTYPMPKLTPFEVLVEVSHSGLCHTDVYMIRNDWGRSTYPLLPGHEVVGKVVQKGSLATVEIGARVGVSWVKSACLQCPQCQEGNTNICPTKIGCYNRGAYGGFATHMVADSRFLYPIPEGLSSASAAPLLCAGATVYAPLRRYQIQPHHHVAILGIGGLGHLGLQFAKAFGAEVTALSTTASKEAEARSFGADHFHTLDNLPKAPLYDLILSTVDADLDWNLMLTHLLPNGTLCFVSRPKNGAQIDFANLVSTQRSLSGSNNANRGQMHEMLQMAARHKIAPQIELMPLSQINEAIERLIQNKVRYRVVLTPKIF